MPDNEERSIGKKASLKLLGISSSSVQGCTAWRLPKFGTVGTCIPQFLAHQGQATTRSGGRDCGTHSAHYLSYPLAVDDILCSKVKLFDHQLIRLT